MEVVPNLSSFFFLIMLRAASKRSITGTTTFLLCNRTNSSTSHALAVQHTAFAQRWRSQDKDREDLSCVEQLLDTKTVGIAALASALKRCGQAKALAQGRLVHVYISRCGRYDKNVFLGNWLVQMYGDCGSMNDALLVFTGIPNPNLYSWTILMKAYCKNGRGREALGCFDQMQLCGVKPDNVTYVCAVDACAGLAALEKGQEIHAAIVDRGHEGDVAVGTSLVNMYGKCGALEDAKSVFGRLQNRNVISWSAMIAAYAQNGHSQEALDLFYQMQCEGIKPNQITFASVLDACASLAALQTGKEIHSTIVHSGYEGQVLVANALINMYGKCGSVQDARSVFDQMLNRDVVSWNTIITACSQNEHGKDALDMFKQMLCEGNDPNERTYACALDACASLAALKEGKEIHAAIIEHGYDKQIVVGTALVNMYGKCGDLVGAISAFHEISHPNVFSWSAIIAACAQNGHGNKALDLFHQMQCDGIKPNEVTFLSVLTACSYTGRVTDGKSYFNSMSQDHGIAHTLEHYVCMIDILGRAGHLDDAENLIINMPFENKARVWLCLLGACRIHRDVERGVRAANHVFELDPENATPYLLLLKLYAEVGRWDDAQKTRAVLETGISKKIIGLSSLRLRG